MRKYLCGICALLAFGAMAQTEETTPLSPQENTTQEVKTTVVKKEVVITETLTTPEVTSSEKETGKEETTAAEETTHEVKITHAVGYAPYEEGRPIEAFFAGLVGTRLDSYVIQQYYQPADDNSRHCFIMVSEEAQKKVKKCVQLEPTVSFKEGELYTILGNNE